MTHSISVVFDAAIVEQDLSFSYNELCMACPGQDVQLLALVDEGVLDPLGRGPQDWVFQGAALQRARTAMRLQRDLNLGIEGAALVLELLDEIDALRARLRRAGLL
jgi:chaperone modulatory protein CbpM